MKRATRMVEVPVVDDVDLALRHLSQRFPDDLARALLPEARSLSECAWVETQLTARQRRIDRGLFVVADGVPRIEHVEWQTEWDRDVPFRLYEYHSLQSLALRDAHTGEGRVPRVRSTLVLLSGRERPWPAHGVYRTSPTGERFSGLRFRIEAPYQRTIAELRARESALWLAFAPLAVDARAEAMPAVVRALRNRTTPRSFEELAVAMAALADADGRKRGLVGAITACLPEEVVMQSTFLQKIREQAEREGRQKGEQLGLQEGRQVGRQEGRQEAVRDAIRTTLKTRGLRLTASRDARLVAETRLEVLQQWFVRALTADRVAEVFADPT